MDQLLAGKTALITGGSRGIGRAVAVTLASHGAKVVIGYFRNETRAREVVQSIAAAGGKSIAIQADLSRATEVSRTFDETERAIGRLDIVVANAADILVKSLVECTEEDYDRIFNSNTRSVFFTLQEAARRLNAGGRIIVSSTGGTKMFFPGQSLYLGSKGAVEQFVRTLSWELGSRGITVNTIALQSYWRSARYRRDRLVPGL
jgi:3-oxoacyl-[acyl-carrier protein] reductase